MTAGDEPNPTIEIAAQKDSKDRESYGPQTRVARADNGFEVPLDKLLRTGERPLLWSIDERMRLARRRAAGRILVRNREVFQVSLASGRQIELTSGQHVLKLDVWKPLQELSAGSRIAVLRRLSEPVQVRPMHDSEVIRRPPATRSCCAAAGGYCFFGCCVSS